MPFGLDTKSVVVGAALGMLVIPRLVSLVASKTK